MAKWQSVLDFLVLWPQKKFHQCRLGIHYDSLISSPGLFPYLDDVAEAIHSLGVTATEEHVQETRGGKRPHAEYWFRRGICRRYPNMYFSWSLICELQIRAAIRKSVIRKMDFCKFVQYNTYAFWGYPDIDVFCYGFSSPDFCVWFRWSIFPFFQAPRWPRNTCQKMRMITHNTTIILKCTVRLYTICTLIGRPSASLTPWDPIFQPTRGPVTCLLHPKELVTQMDTQNTGIDREELVDAFSSPKSGMVGTGNGNIMGISSGTSAGSENGWWVQCTFSCFWTQCRILRILDELLSHWEDVLMHWPEDTFGSHTLAFASQQDCCFTIPGNLFEHVCVEFKNSTFVWPLLSIVATRFCYYPSEYWMITIHLIRYWMSNCRTR